MGFRDGVVRWRCVVAWFGAVLFCRGRVSSSSVVARCSYAWSVTW